MRCLGVRSGLRPIPADDDTGIADIVLVSGRYFMYVLDSELDIDGFN